jgi:hypothetical protein
VEQDKEKINLSNFIQIFQETLIVFALFSNKLFYLERRRYKLNPCVSFKRKLEIHQTMKIISKAKQC